jgi:hypothetical protein
MIRNLCATWRAAALHEILEVQGLMRLLMRARNTHRKWTSEEKVEIAAHLKEISKTIPMLVVFCLPGGSLLLPIFASLVDRRRTRRILSASSGHAEVKRPPVTSNDG